MRVDVTTAVTSFLTNAPSILTEDMEDSQPSNASADPISISEEPFGGAHPVRIALVLEIIEVLKRHGYRRQANARSLAGFLRKLNSLTTSYEGGGH